MSDPFEAQRRYALEAIATLQREYQKAAEPYIRMLVQIESMNTRPIILDAGQWQGEIRPGADNELIFPKPVI